MPHDPFSAILSHVETRAACAGGFTAGGRWAIAFPPPATIKFFVIARGSCWLKVEGCPAPFHLRTGDIFLLSASRRFVAASDLSLEPEDANSLFPDDATSIQRVGDSDEVLFIGGHVDLGPTSGRLLIDDIPTTIHLKAESAEAVRVQWLIQQLVEEFWHGRPGGDFARAALAQLIFLQILRGHLSRRDNASPGWLRAISDSRLAPALRLMHGDPSRNWHLPELARAAAMSRTAFATRFKTAAGVAPLSYLTRWRMQLAERWLTEGTMSVAQIARATGFSSDSAFSNAFKRVTGSAPTQYRAKMLTPTFRA